MERQRAEDDVEGAGPEGQTQPITANDREISVAPGEPNDRGKAIEADQAPVRSSAGRPCGDLAQRLAVA